MLIVKVFYFVNFLFVDLILLITVSLPSLYYLLSQHNLFYNVFLRNGVLLELFCLFIIYKNCYDGHLFLSTGNKKSNKLGKLLAAIISKNSI
jgi:hypothetical protein